MHATINRWVIKSAPVLAHRARRKKKPVSDSWRMDETYIKIRWQPLALTTCLPATP